MDPMVLKYLGLSGAAYGTHVYLLIVQICLFLFLVINGSILLSQKRNLPKFTTLLGFRVNEQLAGNSINGWLMILTGIAFIFPVVGLSHWFAIVASPVAIYWLIVLAKDGVSISRVKRGSFVRNTLAISAAILMFFTIWEGRDLVRTGVTIVWKAAYWRDKEVEIWQKQNNPNAPNVGEMAPDFELTDVHGKKTVRLSDFRDKRPVVLLFGSFT